MMLSLVEMEEKDMMGPEITPQRTQRNFDMDVSGELSAQTDPSAVTLPAFSIR